MAFRKKLRSIIVLLAAAAAYADTNEDYSIMWDIDFSPFAGGEDLLYATRLIEKGEDCFFRKASFKNPKGGMARSLRLGELLALYLPLNYEAMLIQHEVFGHGYRIRSLGSGVAQVTKYHLGAPPPYGDGGGTTFYEFMASLTPMEEMAISIAGVEATAVLANETKWKWLTTRMLDAKQSVLYILCQQDISEYIGSMKTVRSDNNNVSEGHDINSYLLVLNRTYPEKHLSSSRLRSLSWINALDPFTFYSIWAWLHYISSGRNTKIPMIRLWNVGYLFGARLGLAPFGPEVFWENYFSNQGRVYYAYLKGGRHANNTYIGAGVFFPVLWQAGNWEFGARCDIWRQPKLIFHQGSEGLDEIASSDSTIPLYPSSELRQMRFGAALSVTAFYHLNRILGVQGEFGAKSNGFLPGSALSEAAIARLGFSTCF